VARRAHSRAPSARACRGRSPRTAPHPTSRAAQRRTSGRSRHSPPPMHTRTPQPAASQQHAASGRNRAKPPSHSLASRAQTTSPLELAKTAAPHPASDPAHSGCSPCFAHGAPGSLARDGEGTRRAGGGVPSGSGQGVRRTTGPASAPPQKSHKSGSAVASPTKNPRTKRHYPAHVDTDATMEMSA
jgi:hypothetical protein